MVIGGVGDPLTSLVEPAKAGESKGRTGSSLSVVVAWLGKWLGKFFLPSSLFDDGVVSPGLTALSADGFGYGVGLPGAPPNVALLTRSRARSPCVPDLVLRFGLFLREFSFSPA